MARHFGWLLVMFACAANCPGQESEERGEGTLPAETERSGQLGLRAREIYQAARMVPAEVGVFGCFLEAEETLAILLASDVGDGLAAFYARSNGGRVWRELAEELGLSPRALFEIFLGKRLVLVSSAPEAGSRKRPARHPRTGGKGARNSETVSTRESGRAESRLPSWVVLAATSEAEFRQILNLLNADVIRWVNNTVPVYAPRNKSGLQISYRHGTLVLSAGSAATLFDEISGGSFRQSLAELPEFLDWLEDGVGQISFFAHSGDGGGENGTIQVGAVERADSSGQDWTGLSAKITPAGMTIRAINQKSPKASDPAVLFATRKYRAGLDLSALEQINEGAIWVLVERFGIRPASALGSTAITAAFVERYPSVLHYAGPTFFTIVEARDKPVVSKRNVEELLAEILASPAQQIRVAWGVELKKPWSTAARKMDELLLASLNALKLCIDNPDQLQLPAAVVSEPGHLQMVDLTACSKRLVETLPGLERVELHWSVVEGRERAWWLGATDAEMFNGVSTALQDSVRLPGKENELAVGIIDGPAAAALLNSWEEVNPVTEHPLFSRLFYLEEMLKAIPRVYWVVTGNAEGDRTETEITIDWGF